MASDLSDLLDAKKCQFINAMCDSTELKDIKENAAMVSRLNSLKEAELKEEEREISRQNYLDKIDLEDRRLTIDSKKVNIMEQELAERKKERFWNGVLKGLDITAKVVVAALGFKLGRDALKAEYVDKMIVPKDTKNMSNFLMKL